MKEIQFEAISSGNGEQTFLAVDNKNFKKVMERRHNKFDRLNIFDKKSPIVLSFSNILTQLLGQHQNKKLKITIQAEIIPD